MTIPKEEILKPSHLACPGCGGALAMRLALKALGRRTMVVISACCWTVINGTIGYNYSGVPALHTAFETTAVVAAGIKASLEMQGKGDITVMAWAGDGGTFDIGLQSLSGAAERNDDIIYVCYDNEAYMNTGIQRSSATPIGAETTTTPSPVVKDRPKKDLMEIVAAHDVPYVASATIAYPNDLVKKFEKAKSKKGFKLIHILSPCPPGHKFPENKTVEISKLAVETGIFPLYEIEEGKYKINKKPKFQNLDKYLNLQGRFKNMPKDKREALEEFIKKRWERLSIKAEYFS